MDDGQLRKRAFFALWELCRRIGQKRPIVLFVDDLQWGDADSADVLLELLNSAPPILLMGGYRMDERSQSPFLNRWHSLDSSEGVRTSLVEVGPLKPAQCVELMAHRLGCSTSEIADFADELVNRTGGNPYLLEQIVDQFDVDQRRFREYALSDIIEARLAQLPDTATKLLEVVSVAGKAADLYEVSVCAGWSSPPLEVLTKMRSERLIRFIGSSDHPLIDTYHDRIRETTLQSMTAEAIAKEHLNFGETLERGDELDGDSFLARLNDTRLFDETADNPECPTRVFDLAFHFQEAGDPRSFVYQLLAGEEAAQTFAMEQAREHLDCAETLIPKEASDVLRYRLYFTLGQVFTRLRKSEKAEHYFTKALSVASRRVERGRAHAGIGKMHRQSGDNLAAISSFDNALAAIGRHRPKSTIVNLSTVLYEILLQLCVPARWRRSNNAELRSESTLACEVYYSLAPFDYDHGPADSHMHIVTCVGKMASKTGDLNLMAYADVHLTILLGAFGVGFPLAKYFLTRSFRRLEAHRDRELEGVHRSYQAVVTYVNGDINRALGEYPQALEIITRYGNDWEANFAQHNYRRLMNWVGSSSDEIAAANSELSLVRRSNSPHQLGWANYGLAYGHARAGDHLKALDYIHQSEEALSRFEYRVTLPTCYLIHAFVYLQLSEYAHAMALAEKSWAISCKFKSQIFCSIPGLCFLVEAIAGPEWIEQQPKDVTRLRKLLRQFWKWDLVFPVCRPRLDRSRGRALWLLGKERAAVRALRRAVASGRKIGMGYELARSLLDLAAVDEVNREQHRAEGIALLKRVESVIPRAESWLLSDQYDEEVVAPKFDLEAWEREHGTISPQTDADKR